MRLVLACLLSLLYSTTSVEALASERDSGGAYRSVAYYASWTAYGPRNFLPQNLPVDKLTHVLYAFANVDGNTGEVSLYDPWIDVQKHYSTDSWTDTGNNLYGNLKQLFLLKKKNRNLKVLLSIGGWSLSPKFSVPLSSAGGRGTFISSVTNLVKNLGLDGVDIDWEYPKNSFEAGNLVVTLQGLRSSFDAYSATTDNNYHFLITAACPAAPEHYENLPVADMDKYLDFWNLMAYDYYTDTTASHDANLYPSYNNPSSTPFNTDQAVDYYTSHGVDAQKLVLGMPLYGRSFVNTAGPGTTCSGAGTAGSWAGAPGVWDYKAMPLAGAVETEDVDVVASYSYDASQKVMISYDTPLVAQRKADYIKTKGLGGGMWWESSGDKTDSDSLIGTVVNAFGGTGALEQVQNELSYPDSSYDNLKAGFQSSQ